LQQPSTVRRWLDAVGGLFFPHRPLAARPSLAIAPTDDGYLIYDIAGGRVHHLNATAALVFELCDGTRTFDDLREALAPILGDDTWADARAWIERAVRQGPLRYGAAPPPEPQLETAESTAALVKHVRSEGQTLAAFICQHRYTELEPDEADGWYRLGDLAQNLGRRQDARAAYERYRDLLTEPDTTIDMILVSLRGEEPPPRASDTCVKQLFETFAKTYDAHMVDRLYYRAPGLLMDAIRKVRTDLKDLDVLDVGCGTGLHGKLLRPLAKTLIGIDLSGEMLEHARALGIYDQIEQVEIIEYLSRPGVGPFDLESASDVLIYFGDLRQVLEPGAARLKPGGIFGFTTERSNDYPFTLTDSGRFAHHRRHIEDVAGAIGVKVASIDEEILRYEYGDPVHGLVVVLKKDQEPT
jgi:predicted TPR repeat methyltransferase